MCFKNNFGSFILSSKVKKEDYETKMHNRLKRNFKRKSYINSFCVISQLLFFFGAGSNFADTIKYNGKVKLLPLPCEQRKKGQINCGKYIINLTSCSRYRHFSSTCKLYLLFVNDNYLEKQVLKIVYWIYILLGNNPLGNIFAKVIIKALFALAKPSVIVNWQGQFRGLIIPLNICSENP